MSEFAGIYGEVLGVAILAAVVVLAPLMLKPDKGLQLAFFTSGARQGHDD